jgi:hypothetical protein
VRDRLYHLRDLLGRVRRLELSRHLACVAPNVSCLTSKRTEQANERTENNS